MLQLTVNGESRTAISGASVADLLGELGLDSRKVAVERNLEIVAKSSYVETKLESGDRLEIVAFVGGG